tara:strand:+ start:116 stop:403 length:288 start_codon:yes stop_codon:yes gene_type:complete
MKITELLTATHIRPTSKLGSDDVRNGLLLCHLHDKAFKAGLFSINPSTYEITCRESGPDKNELNIITQELSNLPRKPHPKALNWHWKQWLTKNRS